MTTFQVIDDRADGAGTLSETEVRNREVVLGLYETQFNTGDFEQVRRFYAPDFVDHNPEVPGGDLDGLERYVGEWASRFPDIELRIVRVLVDGDFVVLHVQGRLTPESEPDAVMEIWRVRDGLLAEHWEVVQPVAVNRANPNSVF